MAQPNPAVDPKVVKTFSRVIAGVHETLCEKLDLKSVGERLTTGTRLKKTVRNHIKHAVKTKDVEGFYSILLQMFNLKSLVFFLEVLDFTATENSNHKEIVTILCNNLEELNVENEPSEVVTSLEKITSKYVEKPRLYYEHPVETFPFIRGDSHFLHSPTHDVTVCVDSKAFPEALDKFDVSLTVNDYSRLITMPPEYTEVYSPLINLKCEPHFDKFQDFVTVTLPHCAIGNIEDSLCVLSAPDGDSELVEDTTIVIESIDDDYITFKAIHFSNSLISATKKRKQRYLKMRRLRAYLKAASLDETVRRSSIEARPRSQSSPAIVNYRTDTQFCVKMCRPRDISGSSYWKFVFIVTTDEITLTKVRICIG